MSRFDTVKATAFQLHQMTQYRRTFKDIDTKLKAETIDPRYRALALTALEEASMWINKGLTHVNRNTEVSEDTPFGSS